MGTKIRFFGDFTTGENYQLKYDLQTRQNLLRQKGYNFLAEDIKELFEGSYNVVNLESPITNLTETELENKKSVIHWMDPFVAPEFLKSLPVHSVSIGNNHIMDYGKEGLKQTLETLDNAGISHTGAGVDLNSAKRPAVQTFKEGERAVNLYIFGGYKYREDYDLEYNFYAKENAPGVFSLTPDAIKGEIEKIKREDSNSLVVVFPHWGFDFQNVVKDQMTAGKAFIDSGADYVIGHGPHFMHKIEFYKEKPLIYSLGNSIFPADFKNGGAPYSFVFEIELLEEGEILRVYPIYTDNNSKTAKARFIKDSEFEEALWRLTGGNEALKERMKINKGRIICIEL